MKVIYNSEEVEEQDIKLNFTNRVFLYGDGLFETIISKQGSIKYLEYHVERLKEGMHALGMEYPEELTLQNIGRQIHKLLKVNPMFFISRIKIQVWRKPGGLLTPFTNQVEYLISVSPQQPKVNKDKAAEISEKVKIYPTFFSRFKTCNMLPYVLAGVEKERRNVGELIILSHDGYLAECSSSNLFWMIEDEFYTPSLETGCIAGIMRRVVKEKLIKMGRKVHEVKAKPEVLEKAEYVFTTNVSDINYLSRVGQKNYDQPEDFYFKDL